MHEASLHRDNCFITLTYDQEHVPEDFSLDVRHWQLFMKKLRKRAGPGVRFFHCGEYGEEGGRPHYHAILFNLDFGDKKLWKIVDGNQLYTSQLLEQLWGLGFCSLGAVTFQSAAYVARYSLKKITGKGATPVWFHPKTGLPQSRKSEYSTSSKRPAIGADWWVKYGRQVIRDDTVVMNGQEMKPPRYYDKKIASAFPSIAAMQRGARVREARRLRWNSTSGRLRTREIVRTAKVNLKKRNLK